MRSQNNIVFSLLKNQIKQNTSLDTKNFYIAENKIYDYK